MKFPRSVILWLALLLPIPATADTPLTPPIRSEVAPGVYVFRTAPYGDVGLDGNSIAIVSSDGVLVFDANGTPAAARAVLAEIRKLTRQPGARRSDCPATFARSRTAWRRPEAARPARNGRRSGRSTWSATASFSIRSAPCGTSCRR